MLSAADSRELSVIRYELEDFLRRFPAHPQALLLRDDIMRAVRYAERPRVRPPAPQEAWARGPSWFIRIWSVLVVGGLLYLVYRVIKHLLGF
jgi:hypothetical protein